MKLIEKHLVNIKTLLTTNMAAKLAAIAAEYSDGIALDAPLTTSYLINEILAFDQLPMIQILPDTGDVVLTGIRHDEVDHKIIIVAHVSAKEGDTEKCAKRCYRFVRAIWEIILANRTLGDTVIEMYTTGFDYKPMMSDGFTLKQEAWIYVTVKSEER